MTPLFTIGYEAVRRGDIETMRRVFAAHMQADRENNACQLCFERDPSHCRDAISN